MVTPDECTVCLEQWNTPLDDARLCSDCTAELEAVKRELYDQWDDPVDACLEAACELEDYSDLDAMRAKLQEVPSLKTPKGAVVIERFIQSESRPLGEARSSGDLYDTPEENAKQAYKVLLDESRRKAPRREARSQSLE